jgi:probable rRNA maturation factor
MTAVDVVNAHPRYRVARRPVAAYVRHALRKAGIAGHAVTVVLHDDRASRKINTRWLRHREPTDVISFALEKGRMLEGEIYVNLDRARRQAREYRVTFGHEVARLVIHGTLHLTGMDDRSGRQRKRMQQREDALLARWF